MQGRSVSRKNIRWVPLTDKIFCENKDAPNRVAGSEEPEFTQVNDGSSKSLSRKKILFRDAPKGGFFQRFFYFKAFVNG